MECGTVGCGLWLWGHFGIHVYLMVNVPPPAFSRIIWSPVVRVVFPHSAAQSHLCKDLLNSGGQLDTMHV